MLFRSVANTESVQPMAPISAQSKSSERTFTMSTDDLKNIIANVVRMVGNASYSSSLLALSSMSPSSWLMDSACYNHITPPWFSVFTVYLRAIFVFLGVFFAAFIFFGFLLLRSKISGIVKPPLEVASTLQDHCLPQTTVTEPNFI